MNLKHLTKYMAIVLTMAIIFSCTKDKQPMDYYNLGNLPTDTGGVHKAFTLGSTLSPYGYYVYTPSYYNELNNAVFPLLIFLHGSGEKGNSKSDPSILDLVLRNGPPKLIKNNNWSPKHPMVVVSPQCHDGNWDADKLKEFIEYLLTNYNINVKRVYITGLSLGGFGTFNLVGKHGDASLAAAIVPICGSGIINQAENFRNTPVWAFHGDADGTVNVHGSIDMVEAINEHNPVFDAKVTIYPGVGHDSWSKTYDGTGMGTESQEYDAFDQSIYDWMFEYQRNDLDSLIGYYRDCGCS